MVGEHEHHDHRTLEGVADIAPLGRRLAAEFVGTLVFVAVGTGAATALALGPLRAFGGLPAEIQGAPGNSDVFSTLLGNSLSDVLGVAFAFATALAVLIYALGGVSGAHFNPAVTFALAVARRFRWSDVLPYWLVQCLGGIAGAAVVMGMYGEDGAAFGGQAIRYGATVLSSEVLQPGNLFPPDAVFWQSLLAEAFIGFLLMTAIMAVAVDHRAPKGWSGLVIGLALLGGIMVTGAVSGGSANFARSLGPFVVSLRYSDAVANVPWTDLIVYGLGPLIGAAAAALVYESVTGLERLAPAPDPGSATHDHELAAESISATVAGGDDAHAAYRPAGGVVTPGQESGVTPGLAPTGDDPTTGEPPPPGLPGRS